MICLVNRFWSSADMPSGYFFARNKKWVARFPGTAPKFLQQKSHRYELVLHAGTKHFGYPAQHTRNLMQARNVVLIVLNRIERHRQRQISETGVNAILLVDRHLVFFEIKIRDALLQHTNHEVVRELILTREAGTRNRLEAAQEAFVGIMALHNRRERILPELVVIAIIAIGGSPLRKVAEIRLILIIVKSILSREAIGNRFYILGEKNPQGRRQETGIGKGA